MRIMDLENWFFDTGWRMGVMLFWGSYVVDDTDKEADKFYKDWLETICSATETKWCFCCQCVVFAPSCSEALFREFALSPKVNAPLDHPDRPKLECSSISNVPIRYHDQVTISTLLDLCKLHTQSKSANIQSVPLSNAISKLDFSASTFSESFLNFLKCHPIDEVDFFFCRYSFFVTRFEDVFFNRGYAVHAIFSTISISCMDWVFHGIGWENCNITVIK